LAARAIGAVDTRIMFRHILPNCIAPYLILISVNVGFAIIVEASLSFLGAGTPPEVPTWGNMVNLAAKDFFSGSLGLTIGPGLAITLSVLSFNLLGDALRDVLDPRLRGT
jgi:ABC-type dipeptide/oligopeptide/nickel transport system permease subunit